MRSIFTVAALALALVGGGCVSTSKSGASGGGMKSDAAKKDTAAKETAASAPTESKGQLFSGLSGALKGAPTTPAGASTSAPATLAASTGSPSTGVPAGPGLATLGSVKATTEAVPVAKEVPFGSKGNIDSAIQLGPKERSPIVGEWAGKWKDDQGPDASAMNLAAVALQTGPNEWTAQFDAKCGRDASFQMPMKGKKVGEKVVFEGDIDLGSANGGVYHWTGEADGDTFKGRYKSAGHQGGFEMKKVNMPLAALADCPPDSVVAAAATKAKMPRVVFD